MKTFIINRPTEITSPVVLSIPHSGTQIPDELLSEFRHELLPADDTDWFVEDLYSFAGDLGMASIEAAVSRWVIDLNRSPEGTPLYADGRVITGLCPATDFNGQLIYEDRRKAVDKAEVERRRKHYFDPYYVAAQELLDEVYQKFGVALLWDCHSIRRYVPGIQPDAFPDLILGTVDGLSVPDQIEKQVALQLASGNYQLSLNAPFKGGNITRTFGKPGRGQYAIQLELSKDSYMDDQERNYHPQRAAKLAGLLRETLSDLSLSLKESVAAQQTNS